MSRIDYFDVPDAPRATRIVPGATAFILDEQQRVLLIRRTDNGLWSMPGGAQDIGEHIADTAVRETREETGLYIAVTGIVGVYTDPRHIIAYSDGEVRQQFSLCLRARHVAGQIAPSDEASDVRWVSRQELDGLQIHPSIRLRVDHGFENRPEPYLG